MSGHVFHPGHEELHGVTVVVESDSGRTWVGRYHERTERGVMLRDAAMHDAESATQPREEWIERQIRFGIRVDQRMVVVPGEMASRITRLAEWKPSVSK